MTPSEAFELLDVSEDISDEDLKIKYKDLAKKYHPDRYKEDPDKFKKINEAYQLIQDYRQNPNKYQPAVHPDLWSNFSDLGISFNFADFFNAAQRNEAPIEPIRINIDISFHDAVLGCSKEINYTRNGKCQDCNGIGSKRTSNGCDKCDGFGRISNKNGNMFFQTGCGKCYGRGIKSNKCQKCNGKRTIKDNRVGQINIPPGTTDGKILRLSGGGNFVGQAIFGEHYEDALITVKVISYKDFKIKDNDIHSDINISLLEALKGSVSKVETVYGDKEITIPNKSKNGDVIKIPNAGIKNTKGAHILHVNVSYPDEVEDLIKLLENKAN